MNAGLARLVVRLSAWLAPSDQRERWREEWLGEVNSRLDQGASSLALLRRTLGAPWDAALVRARGWSLPALRSGWRQDFVQTIRVLRREPWHVVAVALCLGVGITAAVTTFSVINSLLYGAIPGVADRSTLSELYLRETGRMAHFKSVSIDDHAVLAANTPAGVSLTASTDIRARGNRVNLALRLGGDSVPIVGQFVAGNFFDVLGTTAARGRLIAAADDRLDNYVAVIGHEFWRTNLGASADVVGSTLTISGQAVRIIGVAPPRFSGGILREADEGAAPELWLPLSLASSWPGESQGFVTVLVRQQPGTSRATAEASLGPIVRQLPMRRGIDSMRPLLRPIGHGRDGTSAQLAIAIVLVMAAPIIVVLIGCANVANLRLARATARTRELAVRLSLGATRGQLARLQLLEAAVLTAVATLAGWIGAQLLITLASPIFESVLPMTPSLDLRVLAFAAALMLLVVIASGYGPAWLTTRRLVVQGLRESPQAGGRAHGRLRHGLVAIQVALSLVLLVVAALFGRSLQTIAGSPPALYRELVIARVDPARLDRDPTGAARLASAITDRLRADRRVLAAGVCDAGLFENLGFEAGYRRPGEDDRAWRIARMVDVSPDWFRALDLSTVAGRTFTGTESASPIAVVNETMAAALVSSGAPIGMSIEIQKHASRTEPFPVVRIAGVVSDAPMRPGTERPERVIYLPFTGDRPTAAGAARPFTLFVRSNDAAGLMRDLRRVITEVEPRAPWTKVDTAMSLVAEETTPVRVVAGSLGSLGAVALTLAATGLYAVMAYVVALRTREIGIRMALGARPGDVLRLVLRQTLRLTVAGLTAGLLVSIPTAYALRGMLEGVSFIDPLSILPAVSLLIVVGLLAAVIPARRAAAVDPVAALRSDL
jgi:predicted permease